MENRPIPAFYCCYLLRFGKTVGQQIYIGSTPNPRRRLAQHLGHTKGGALRTARAGKEWTMACIVTGFPSKIAALQFEWAWHNPHLTKRVLDQERIVLPGKGKGRRPKKPYCSLKTYLSHLHLLLRGPSFQGWPLSVRFFSEDVFERWRQACASAKNSLRPGIEVSLDLDLGRGSDMSPDRLKTLSTHAKGRRRREAIGKGGVNGVDVEYTRYTSHVEKSLSILSEGKEAKCAVCSSRIDDQNQMVLVCPFAHCRAVSHMQCLASKFQQGSQRPLSTLPHGGDCPKCNAALQWIEIVREMTLRARGPKEVTRLLRKSRKTEVVGGEGAVLATVNEHTNQGEDDGIGEALDEGDDVPDDPLPDDWMPQDLDSDDSASVTSVAPDMSREVAAPKIAGNFANRLPHVIEDSEDDVADIID